MKVASWDKLDLWLEARQPDSERNAAYDALTAVCDGTYLSQMSWGADAVDESVCHVRFGDEGNVLSWRAEPSDPDVIQVIYVGPVEFF